MLEYWRTDVSGRFFRTQDEWFRYLAKENSKKWKNERIKMRKSQIDNMRQSGVKAPPLVKRN